MTYVLIVLNLACLAVTPWYLFAYRRVKQERDFYAADAHAWEMLAFLKMEQLHALEGDRPARDAKTGRFAKRGGE